MEGKSKKINKLIEDLKRINKEYRSDPEEAHCKADDALLNYINDKDVNDAYGEIEKWYA